MKAVYKLPICFLLILLIPFLIWYHQTGSLAIYFAPATPPGQLLYVLSKLAGMVALVCIAWQLIVTLLDKLQWLSLQWLGFSHRVFGIIILLLMWLHLLLFFSAVSIRQDEVAWSLWLPDFRDFYHTHLTFGLMGLYVMCLVAVTGLLSSVRSIPWINMLHRLYWFAIGLVYFHALAVGSEAQSSLGMLLYISLGLAIILLGCIYGLKQIKTRTILS